MNRETALGYVMEDRIISKNGFYGGDVAVVREVYENELSKVLELYLHLHVADKTAFIQWIE